MGAWRERATSPALRHAVNARSASPASLQWRAIKSGWVSASAGNSVRIVCAAAQCNPQQRLIGCVLDQRVLEQVVGSRRHPTTKQQTGTSQRAQRRLQIGLRPLRLRDARDQLVREFAAEQGATRDL
jgi:hypothetical protein